MLNSLNYYSNIYISNGPSLEYPLQKCNRITDKFEPVIDKDTTGTIHDSLEIYEKLLQCEQNTAKAELSVQRSILSLFGRSNFPTIRISLKQH